MKTWIVSATVFLSVLGCSKLSEQELMKNAIEAHKGSQFDDALENYQALTVNYPKSLAVPEALYAMGSIYQTNKHDAARAISAYKRIATEFPDHATASSAAFLVGYLYNNEVKNYDSARLGYENFLRRYPGSPMISSARFELENLGKDPAEILNAKVKPSETPATKKPKK